MAAKPRVESSEPKFRKIWSSIIGSKELFEAHNEGESEVESRLETNVKRQVESKVQTCVGNHESEIYDINAETPPDYSNTTPSAQPQLRTPAPPVSPSSPPIFS